MDIVFIALTQSKKEQKMLVKNFDFSSATTTLVVNFPMQPINAAFADMLREHLFETVLFERNCADEYLYVGDEYSRITNVANVIRYQFGCLDSIEYACDEIAVQLQQHAEEWVESMGGYEKIKA